MNGALFTGPRRERTDLAHVVLLVRAYPGSSGISRRVANESSFMAVASTATARSNALRLRRALGHREQRSATAGAEL